MNLNFPERTVVSARSDAGSRCLLFREPLPGNQFAGRGFGAVHRGGHHAAARTMGAYMTVSFHLSPEQEQLKLGARQFAEEHLRPLAAEVRKEPDPLRRALLARPTFEKAVAAGFLKGLIPAPFGGAAAGGVEACILIEEWACHSPDFVISLAGPLMALRLPPWRSASRRAPPTSARHRRRRACARPRCPTAIHGSSTAAGRGPPIWPDG